MRSYLKLLSEIGLEVGLAKSVLSPKGHGLEFAKRTIINGNDLSPLSLKELEMALTSASAWVALCSK